jgi:hypothetical protein
VSLVGPIKALWMWGGLALLSVVLGAVIAGTVDAVAPSLTAGTLLGPGGGEVGALVWTVIGGVIVIGGREVVA